LVIKALITKGSGQHVSSGTSQHAVDAGTSSSLLLKVRCTFFFFYFVLFWLMIFCGNDYSWKRLFVETIWLVEPVDDHLCTYRFQVPLPKAITGSNWKVTIHSIRNKPFLSRRVV
jgi:hypothetical protein